MHTCMHPELQARSHGSSKLEVRPFQQYDALQSDKRYLILAYKAEFDQILYPLPLCHEDCPKPDFFRGIIKRLQAEKRAAMQVQTSCLTWAPEYVLCGTLYTVVCQRCLDGPPLQAHKVSTKLLQETSPTFMAGGTR